MAKPGTHGGALVQKRGGRGKQGQDVKGKFGSIAWALGLVLGMLKLRS